jgi:hypothetical protein
MIRRLVEEGGMRGFHFCTLNLEKSVRCILETLGWAPGHANPHARLIAVSFRDNVGSPRFYMSIRNLSGWLHNLQLPIPTSLLRLRVQLALQRTGSYHT